jgi:hypothetical protein
VLVVFVTTVFVTTVLVTLMIVALMVVALMVVVVLDGIEKRLDIIVLAADQPDDELVVFIDVVPGQHALDAVTIDGDVFTLVVDGSDDGELDLGVGWLVAQHVDEFADGHGFGLSLGAWWS